MCLLAGSLDHPEVIALAVTDVPVPGIRTHGIKVTTVELAETISHRLHDVLVAAGPGFIHPDLTILRALQEEEDFLAIPGFRNGNRFLVPGRADPAEAPGKTVLTGFTGSLANARLIRRSGQLDGLLQRPRIPAFAASSASRHSPASDITCCWSLVLPCIRRLLQTPHTRQATNAAHHNAPFPPSQARS